MHSKIGRYVVFEPIAAGGMASVHLGRMMGPLGFTRTVAVKRLHPHLLEDGAFVTMLVDEARLASRIQHPSVVQTIDIVAEKGEVVLVMEYVHGESLAKLLRLVTADGGAIPAPIAATIAVQMLRGLHAAHDATDEDGKGLGIVHRDVSPQNVLVGSEGEVKLIDFGIAKAMGRMPTTRTNGLKGKLSYMAPEQLFSEPIDRRVDVYAAGIVLWEMLVGARLYEGEDPRTIMAAVAAGVASAPSLRASQPIDPKLDRIVLTALARSRDDRYPSAAAMADAIESNLTLAPSSRVSAWMRDLCVESLDRRRDRLREIERGALDWSENTDLGQLAAVGELTRTSHGSSVDTSPTPAARPKRSLLALVALALLATLFGLGAVLVRPRTLALAPPEPTAKPPVDPSGAPEASETPSTPPASAAPTSVRVEDAAVLPSASASARPARPWRPPPAPPKPAATLDCSNPYVLDANGHRRYRRECLQR